MTAYLWIGSNGYIEAYFHVGGRMFAVRHDGKIFVQEDIRAAQRLTSFSEKWLEVPL